MQSVHVIGFVCSKLICSSVKCQQKVSQLKPTIVTIYVDSRHCVPKCSSSRMEKLKDVYRHQMNLLTVWVKSFTNKL